MLMPMATTPADALPPKPSEAISKLMRRQRHDPISLDEAAREIGNALLDAYGPALVAETVVIRGRQVVGLTPGTYHRLLRAIRRGVRATGAQLPT